MTSDADRIRAGVRDWLEEHWDPERPLAEWREILVDSGWACPTWPKRWHGHDLSRELAAIVDEEFDRVGAVGPAIGVGMGLAAPTILDHGSDDLKARLLRRIVTGQDTWCQLFSEPGSGSDLAGLASHAELVGDEWVVNGQKVWTTGARTAAFGLLLARTDWDVPKHRGITYFVLPMRQEGVEVRPIRQMNGFASFNEVFLSDARVPAANLIGEVNEGWRGALTTLSYERAAIGSIFTSAAATGRRPGRTATEAAEEATAYLRTYQWYPSRMGRVDLLVPHARAAARTTDPIVRQRIAQAESLARIDRWTRDRAREARRAGRPGPEGSIGKLVTSRIAQAAARAHAVIAGPRGMLAGSDGPLDGVGTEITLSFPAQSIAGGTDEIQLNILAERVLGLPKEPQVDTEIPFREVRRSTRPR